MGLGRIGFVLAAAIAGALTLAALQVRATVDAVPAGVDREFGVPGPVWRIAPSAPVPGYSFAAWRRSDGVPCLAWAGDDGGGSCYAAVGTRGGWPVEGDVRPGRAGAYLIALAVREARSVRVGRSGATVATQTLPGAAGARGLRFVVAPMPRSALGAAPASIVALDAAGRVLERAGPSAER